MTRLWPKACSPAINPSPPIIQNMMKPRKASSEAIRSGPGALAGTSLVARSADGATRASTTWNEPSCTITDPPQPLATAFSLCPFDLPHVGSQSCRKIDGHGSTKEVGSVDFKGRPIVDGNLHLLQTVQPSSEGLREPQMPRRRVCFEIRTIVRVEAEGELPTVGPRGIDLSMKNPYTRLNSA